MLVKIMYDYGLRALYRNNFEDLHCKFYQLERLMQVRKLLFSNVCYVLGTHHPESKGSAGFSFALGSDLLRWTKWAPCKAVNFKCQLLLSKQ